MLRLKVIGLILCFYAIASGTNAADKYTDENRPYEFGFTIEGEQHRHEKKDENGIIMGEFGFITADGVYHVTVYATDENGAFKILSMKNIRVKPYPTAGVKKGHSLPFPPSQNAPVLQGPSSSKSDQESKLEQANKPKASPTKSCSHCKVPTTTTVAPKLTDLAVVSKDRASIFSSQSVYQENNPQVNSGIQGTLRPQESNVNQNFPSSGLGRQNNPSYSFDHNKLNRQEAPDQQNNLQHNYKGPSGISGSSYSQNDGNTNDYLQPNAPNFNSQQDNNESPRNYIQKNDGIQFNQNGNQDYGNLNYPQGSKLNSPQQAINGGPKNYQPGNAVNQFYQKENPEGLNNFNQNLQPEQNIKQGFGNQNYPQEPNNFNENLQPQRNINEMYPQGLSDTNNDYAQQGKPFGQPQATPSLSNIPSSNSEIGTINSQTPQGNLRNPKQYNDIYSTTSGIGQPKGFRDILESQVNQPFANKPTLVAAQMQIVPKDTDIFYKSPGEKEGLPDGISKDNMTNLLYTFNYTVGFHGHHEEGYTNGAKQGYYYVTGRNGVRTRVDYVADENGFRPRISQEVLELLSDDVPKPETEKEERFGLKGYEFKWLYFPAEEARQK